MKISNFFDSDNLLLEILIIIRNKWIGFKAYNFIIYISYTNNAFKVEAIQNAI